MATDCRLQRQLDAACTHLRDWLTSALPIFQQLSVYDGSIPPAGAKTPADLLTRLDTKKLDRFVDSLRSALGGS
jgi:hypothetical protein